MTPVIAGLRRCSRIVAESPAMRALLVRAAPIAGADASVVLLGESGSGKEVLARALHANGPRRGKPFVPVNVAALPGDLLESELFGHAKGAFTGATHAHSGLFVAAEGGTLFLDEIGEMPLPLQAKLLRALQDGEIRHVGGSTSFSVDVRIVCATHADLRGLVAQSRFREDLYYRLKVFALTVPPLRERVEDIMPLAEMFLEREPYKGTGFTPKARRMLEQHAWPGNVRELANAVKHGAVLAMGAPIGPEHLPDEVTHPANVAAATTSLRSLADVEREHVIRVLEACGGQQTDAARVLGIARNTLWRKMRAFGIHATG